MVKNLIMEFFEMNLDFEAHLMLDDKTYTVGHSEDKGIYGDYPEEYETAEDFINDSDEVVDFVIF